MAGCGDFAAVVGAAVDLGERFFADFGIGILHSVYGAVAPHHRNPTSANKPAGQDSWALITPGLDDSTAPMADECQFFWRMLLLSLGADKPLAWMGAAAACATLTGRGGTMLSNAWLSKADRQVLSAALGSGMEVCSTRGQR
jgi:hypothetical protein